MFYPLKSCLCDLIVHKMKRNAYENAVALCKTK